MVLCAFVLLQSLPTIGTDLSLGLYRHIQSGAVPGLTEEWNSL